MVTHLRPTRGYNYHITVVDLEHITVQGSADVLAAGAGADQVYLGLACSAHTDMDDFKADEVKAHGSAEITVSGEGGAQRVSVAGSGTFDGTSVEGTYVAAISKPPG